MKVKVIIQHKRFVPQVKEDFWGWFFIRRELIEPYGNILVKTNKESDAIVCETPLEAKDILDQYIAQEFENNRIIWHGQVTKINS